MIYSLLHKHDLDIIREYPRTSTIFDAILVLSPNKMEIFS